MRRLLWTVLPVAVAAAVIVAWWALVTVLEVPSFFVPSPLEVAQQPARMPGYLVGQTWTTLVETLAGFGLAVLTGVATAMILGAWRPIEHAVMPSLVALNAVPKVAIAPLLVLWLGFDLTPKVVLVWLISVFPILLATLAGLRSTPVELVELAKSLSASRLAAFLKIRLPWALPQIFTGLKVSIQLAVIGAVVAEVTSPTQGLGALVVTSATLADTALVFTAVVLLAVLNVSLFYLIVAIEKVTLPWARATTG